MGPFVRAVEQSELPPLQIIGGNGSAALLHDDTVVDLASGTIEAPASCDLPRYRPDGSLRDMDALVLSSEHRHIDRVQALAEEIIGPELKISIFGLKTTTELEQQRRRPLRSSATVFLGDRYVDCSYDAAGRVVGAEGFKALYPFRAAITAESLDTFRLTIDGRASIPTAHPGATILNYLTRSISGLRAKDTEKVARISRQVSLRHPEIRAWMHDGPGRETLDLARVLHTLGEPRRHPRRIGISDFLMIEPYRLVELADHRSFMATHLSPRGRRAVIEAARAKARLVGSFEAMPPVVSFWQKHVEDRIQRIVHNEL